jgi:hypothetical protein
MKVFITSCNRFDLLQRTIKSLVDKQAHPITEIVVHEDGVGGNVPRLYHGNIPLTVKYTNGIGQHKSIEKFLNENNDKYFLGCEDDWEFDNYYDWIGDSVTLMNHDTSIIKVLCRADSIHPCVHDKWITNGGAKIIRYGELKKWRTTCDWYGFSWNCGVTRADLLKQIMPFGKYEQDVVFDVFKAGYKTVELEKKVYKHIGDNRSTHE